MDAMNFVPFVEITAMSVQGKEGSSSLIMIQINYQLMIKINTKWSAINFRDATARNNVFRKETSYRDVRLSPIRTGSSGDRLRKLWRKRSSVDENQSVEIKRILDDPEENWNTSNWLEMLIKRWGLFTRYDTCICVSDRATVTICSRLISLNK